MAALTPRQRDAMLFVQRFTDLNGFSPSFREIATALDLKSKSNVHRMLDRLEAAGFVKRHPSQHRGIGILQRVDDPAATREARAAVAYRDALLRISIGGSVDAVREAREVLGRFP
jgi:repressor LexA